MDSLIADSARKEETPPFEFPVQAPEEVKTTGEYKKIISFSFYILPKRIHSQVFVPFLLISALFWYPTLLLLVCTVEA